MNMNGIDEQKYKNSRSRVNKGIDSKFLHIYNICRKGNLKDRKYVDVRLWYWSEVHHIMLIYVMQ